MLNFLQVIALIVTFGAPIVAMRSDVCPVHIGLLEKTISFGSMLEQGVATAEQICTLEDMLPLVYAFNIFWCYLYRAEIKDYTVERSIRLNKTPDTDKIFRVCRNIAIFAGAVCVFTPYVGRTSRAFEIKQMIFLMMSSSGVSLAIGFAVAYAPKRTTTTNGAGPGAKI